MSSWEEIFGEAIKKFVFGDGNPEELSKYVILVLGVSAKNVESKLENQRKVGPATVGEYNGITVSVLQIPAGTLRLEQFMRLMPSHTKYVIGLGATGALQPDIEIGELVIPDESVKGEGMSQYYYPPDVPAKPDQELTDIMLRISSENGAKVHTGRMFTTGSIMRETDEYIKDWHNKGYLSVDCEASAFFTLAQFCGLKSALVLYVSDNPYTMKIFTHSVEKRLKMRRAEEKAIDTIFQTLTEISKE